ncbi:hypothetical protein Kpol_1049p20 [Vanderwaltozyma polyspora DSM 70294]|uniref:Major facilitator superfamily (MFS) profile domain-containing protein n=1 Tax=Vanderwaltozyma polyspora (strain ATCC 22028 / DSM 70294 / BCRC 21397 / CBS 2163 / NBRC 10782 / NRRL Y-8283 / UCD 57-17) TaxID=436907 RepID=A7TPR0_VANPO|nr:uncharacterized protein Kpol_1049p20 [Vanderwaltozyma polyspora DSM 70294]EDO15762.1 hypothetical protein Kpol_1049p20 [Vanderwaltozyma polyspora DSM 70294]
MSNSITDSQNMANVGHSDNLEPISSQNSTPSNKMGGDDMDLKAEGHEEYIQEVGPLSQYFGVLALCLMVAFGGFIFGWDTGTISGFIAQKDFLRRLGSLNDEGVYYFSKVRTGLVVGIFNVGCAIGGLTLGGTGDRYGRRIGLMIVTVVYIVGIVIQIATINKWYQYFIGRIISGMGVGGIAVLSPTLISETAPAHLRGTAVAFYQLMITAGIFLGYCTNYGTKNYDNSVQWRVPLGLGFAWALFMLGGMTLVPESPRYLVQEGRIEEAKRSLAISNKCTVDSPVVIGEYENIAAGVEAERSAGSATWGELFSTNGKILQRVIMGVMVNSLQQLTGANYFFYYGTTVFQAVGLEDSFETSIVFGIVNFASTFVALWTVERFGRRRCLLWGSATMTCCFVIYASVGVTRLYPDGIDNKEISTSTGAGNCMICFTCFFIFCFATTWAPTAYVIISESFPLRIRAKAISVAVGANWLWGFLISFFTPFITEAINFYYGYVFMGCLVFSWFYVFFFVCETKGLSLEEVNEMYEEGVLPWKSPNWVPSGRRDMGYDADAALHDNKPWYKRFM